MGADQRIEDLAPLCKIRSAASVLGVPEASLRTAAETHGYIVRMGRAVVLERDRLLELVKKCRDKPREQGSTDLPTARTGTSVTPDAQINQRAANAVKMLKKSSRPTSLQKDGTVLPMNRGM